MKKTLLLLALLLSINSFGTCPIELEDTNLCANIEWIDGPNLDNTSEFKLIFWKSGDTNQSEVELDFSINVYSWMTMQSGHSHGGPAMTFEKIGDSEFLIKDARFFMGSMKGFWEVRIDLLKNESVFSTGKIKVDFN